MPALLSHAARAILLFNSNHGNDGKFASTGGTSASVMRLKPSHGDNLYPSLKGRGPRFDPHAATIDEDAPSAAPKPGRIARIAKAAVWLPHHIEHAAKAGIAGLYAHAKDLAKASGGGWDKPSVPLTGLAGKTIGGLKMAGMGVLKIAYAPWIAGAKAVEAVSRAKGLSAEDAAKVRALVTAYDCVNCKAVIYGLHAAGMPHLAAASSLIPTASVAYLAGSFAKNPRLVAGVAKQAVMKAAAAIHGSYSSAHTPSAAYFSRAGGIDAKARMAVGVLADAIKAHSGDDFWWACLANAMDVASSPAQAVAIANNAIKNTSPQRRRPAPMR